MDFLITNLFYLLTIMFIIILKVKCECILKPVNEITCYDESGKSLNRYSKVKINELITIEITTDSDGCTGIRKYALLSIPPSDGDFVKKKVVKGQIILETKRDSNEIFLKPNYVTNSAGVTTFKVFRYDAQKVEVIGDGQECIFTVLLVKPRASLSGSSEWVYPINSKIIIECTATNLNTKEESHQDLSFNWECSLLKGSDSRFCTKSSMSTFKDKNTITIPPKTASLENSFLLTVKVGILSNPSYEYVTILTQRVLFNSGDQLKGTLEIECKKNCYPKREITTPNHAVILRALLKEWTISADAYLWWTVSDSSGKEIDYSNLRNRRGDEFYLIKGALQANQKYLVKVEVIGGPKNGKKAEMYLNTKIPPAPNCDITPKEGIALKTLFKIECSPLNYLFNFNLFSILKNGKVNSVMQTTHPESETFMLSAGVALKLEISSQAKGFTYDLNLKVTVKNGMELNGKSKNEASKIVTEKLDNLLDLAKDDESDSHVLQGLSAIVSEFHQALHDETLLKNLDKRVISAIEQIDIHKPEIAQQAVDIVSQISDNYKLSDPDISAKVTDICIKARKTLYDQVKYSKSPEIISAQVERTIKSMASCSQAGLKKDEKTIQTSQINITIPELIPVSPVPFKKIPTENYPDYMDDENATENMAKFEKAANSMQKLCFSNAKMMTLTMVPEEKSVKITEGFLDIIAARVYCAEVDHRKIQSADNDGLWILASLDCFKKRIHIVDVLMCSTDKNPYWYMDNIKLISLVIFLKFTGTGKEISAMNVDLIPKRSDKPFIISLPSLNNFDDAKKKIRSHKAELPNLSVDFLNEINFYDIVSTHRIFIRKNNGFTVEFQNLNTTDLLDVVISHFEKPSFLDFKENKILISFKNSKIDLKNIHNYDSFWYLTVLPHHNKLENSLKKEYYFSVTSTGCYSWNEITRRWEPACYSLSGYAFSSNISCVCYYGSSFTAYIRENRVNLEENLLINFKLKLKCYWIIFLTVIITFIIFSIVIFLVSFEEPNDILDKIFFLGDVPSLHQYAYILAVTTGKKKHAGTTSNVTIKLKGTEGESLPHVLNYPDPELFFMQKDSQFFFVLATAKSLGNLAEIQIWFDSIGNNTKWYCSYIEVYDITENKSWLFQTDKWFLVSDNEHNKFTIVASPEIPLKKFYKKKSNKIIRVINTIKSFFGRMENEVNLWNLTSSDLLLTRVERVILIFSISLQLYFLIMLLYSVPNFNESDIIDPNKIGVELSLIWIPLFANLVSAIFNFPIILLLRRTKIGLIVSQNAKHFPMHLIKIICWTIILLILISSLTGLIIGGFWIPFDTSILWVVSVFFAIIFNIFITNNLFCIMYNRALPLLPKNQIFRKFTQQIMDYIDLQRVWIYKRFGSLGLRPYLTHLYYNLDFVTVKERFKWEKAKILIREILEDVIMISLYVVLLYLVLAFDKEDGEIYNHNEIKNLIKGKAINHEEINVESISSLEYFLSQIFLPSIQSTIWYGKYVEKNPGMTKDFSNKYLGIIRLRQHRTAEIECKLPNIMKDFNKTCSPGFNQLKEKRSFSKGWLPENEISRISTERMGNIWKYTDSRKSGSSFYIGEYGSYSGGGYIVNLGRNLKNSLINMKYLKNHHWLDFRTRALFIEFLTYNPNSNLFNGVNIIYEINSSGHIYERIKIKTRKLIMIDKNKILTRNIIITVFFIVVLALFVRIIWKFSKKKKEYFYDIWAIFDIVIVILSVLSVYLYFSRLEKLRLYVKAISESKNNEFIHYFDLFSADNTLTTLMAVLVFTATLRLWKLLRFMIIVKTAEKTIKDAGISLYICISYHIFFIIAFSCVAMVFFGESSKDFKNFGTALQTLVLLSINLCNDFDMDSIQKYAGLGVIFYIIYMLISFFFINIYIAIISLYYADSKDFYADERSTVQKFIQEKWKHYNTLCKKRIRHLRGGEDQIGSVIKAKSGERYEGGYAIEKNRLDAMALISMCVLRNLEENTSTLEDYDFSLISQTIMKLFYKGSSSKEMFFPTGDSHHISFIDDRKIRKIAEICERLVNENIQKIPRHRQESYLIKERISRINSLIANVQVLQEVLNNIQIQFK